MRQTDCDTLKLWNYENTYYIIIQIMYECNGLITRHLIVSTVCNVKSCDIAHYEHFIIFLFLYDFSFFQPASTRTYIFCNL